MTATTPASDPGAKRIADMIEGIEKRRALRGFLMPCDIEDMSRLATELNDALIASNTALAEARGRVGKLRMTLALVQGSGCAKNVPVCCGNSVQNAYDEPPECCGNPDELGGLVEATLIETEDELYDHPSPHPADAGEV